ncbi:gamma-glutamyltransferase family protein [Alteribacillus sp. HJP-4]|uniref:gamma-glutamyltransferase family protein n=1 Tax=Alteribacillus sp. HJP-4 TaxID=2775394 RepID=UPI0035CCED51
MKDQLASYPYRSKRVSTIGRKGMTATSHPLASQAGLDMLKIGGNAVDAAIAMAACLTVVEPSSNGIGGDAFALVWINEDLYGLNASGPAPQSISAEQLKQDGHQEMPARGFTPVTVPGAPAAWAALSDRFGRLPFQELLQPAITYAREGYALTPTLARNWRKAILELTSSIEGERFDHFFQTFAPKGSVPNAGDVWKSEAFADTLEKIAESKSRDFYEGILAGQIDTFSKQHGGYIRKQDLEAYAPEWVTPIGTSYKGYDIWEIPPNGQGLIALMALNLLKSESFPHKENVDTYHHQIEAMKLAFADGEKFITDSREMTVKAEMLLTEAYAAERRALINGKARLPESGQPQHSGTVYLAAADEEGCMVSFIQSNYQDFGSALLVPGTGILLQNRGHNFSLNPDHSNFLQPGKKTYHTIIPGFITKDKQPIGPFGVMGAFMQPQGHVQTVMNMIDFKLNPQAALDAPRWQWLKDKQIMLETSAPPHVIEGLAARGHEVVISPDSNELGRGQVIWRDPESHVLYGGTESRTDGAIAVW